MSSHLISLASFLVISFSLSIDMVRQSLEAASEKWFSWLLVSSGVVAVGCILEVFETWASLKRWRQLRKHLPVEEENSTSWLIPIGAVGLLLVIFGVIGEGVFEDLSSKAETALRDHDSQILAQAEEDAGNANERAGNAEKETVLLESAIAGRELTPTEMTEISNSLRRFRGRSVWIGSYSGDAEAARLGIQMKLAFEKAGIHVENELGRVLAGPGGVDFGIHVTRPPEEGDLAQAISDDLRRFGKLDVAPKTLPATVRMDKALIGIMVALKPIKNAK